MAPPLYTNAILRLATETLNWPRLDSADVTVEQRAPLCGSNLLLDLAFDMDGRIEAVGMRPQSCAMGQASATLFARHAIDRNAQDMNKAHAAIQNWLRSKNDPDGMPDWPDIELLAAARDYPARHGAIMLPFDAAVAAFEKAAADKNDPDTINPAAMTEEGKK